MDTFAGLDVSVQETALCVVDGEGNVLLETTVTTDPQRIAKALAPYRASLRRVGHEAGALSPWLHPALQVLGLPVTCLEARRVRAALSAQRNKTDAADARGIAHILRTGWYGTAHIKQESTYRLRLLLTQRRNLKRKFLDLENTIRHSLKAFGVQLHKVGRGGFDEAVRKAVADDALTRELMDSMLTARAALWKEYLRLHNLVVRYVAQNPVCRQFMAIPGVGPVTALSFMTAVEDPARFKRSRDVAAYFGLTSKRWQSGTSIDIQGRISKAGDPDVRRSLYEAATVMLKRYRGQDKVREWGLQLARKSCHHKAAVAVARKLAVVMHAMWRDGTTYVGNAADDEATRAARQRDKDVRLLGAALA
ncbi:MAG: IS110 family transposase [Rubrivivax sp. SCN 70-15]|nr:MAG: IS110 family transposase [Rubrivivax sp. SCN 70-15]